MAVELDGKNGTVCKHAMNHQLIQVSTTKRTSKQTSIAIYETSTIPMNILTPVSTSKPLSETTSIAISNPSAISIILLTTEPTLKQTSINISETLLYL